jgi:hypothetical protein
MALIGTINAPNDFGLKNRIINGAMVIDQRNAGASVTPTDSYTLDRWQAERTQASKFSVQQNAGSVTSPAGFNNYLGVTSLSAYSVISTDYFVIRQMFEGFNTADLAFGTAAAQPVTLSFWVRSSLTGTFGGSLKNNNNDRSYLFSYTISSANTWEYKTVTIPGDTTGTWPGATNGRSMTLSFSLGAGASNAGTAGSWQSGNLISTTGATSVVGTNGATFYITGVQLEKGTQATAFDYRPYGTELALCQRYYLKNTGIVDGGGVTFATVSRDVIVGVKINFMTEMRSTPTLTMLGTTGRSGGDGNGEQISTIGFSWGRKKTGSGSAEAYAFATGGFEVTAEL